LPRKPRKRRSPVRVKPPLLDYIKWWRKLNKEMRNMYIQETYHAQL